MSKKVNNPGCKIYVKPLAGAKTTCIKDHMQASLRYAPNYSIIDYGTNYFNSDKTAEGIANTIIAVATSLKNDQNGVSISNIIIKTDNHITMKKEG